MTYFSRPETLEELKSQYHELAFKHHPDCGGDTATMQAVNAEYDRLFSLLKNTHRNKDGEKYTTDRENEETPDQFKDLVAELMRMDGIIIEIIGSFVWLTGNTRTHKDRIKEIGFKFSGKKIAWYLAPAGYRRHGRTDYSLDTIRGMYGTRAFNSTGMDKLDEARS